MKLSRLVQGIELSITLALDARAKALAAEGRDVISMAVGEPDFPAPASARQAAAARAQSGDVRYTAAAGAAFAREAIARHLTETRGVDFAPEQVVVCHSCKHALSGTLLATVEPGDEVLIPLPAWVSYFELVRIAGGVPVEVPPAAGCRPDVDSIKRAITPRTRVLMINSPCNPSGYVFTHDETAAVAQLAVDHGLTLISDEIYRGLVFGGEPAKSPVSLSLDARAQTVIVDGASKGFAMTGYRIGFVAGPPQLAAAVTRLHSQMTGAPNTISQAAYAAALAEDPPEVEEMRREFAARRDLLLAGLERLGLETPYPRGAFYAFPNVASLLDERGSVGLCENLLDQQNLALVPGSAFGMDEHVRLSYALPRDTIEVALGRLAAFLRTQQSA